MNSDPKAEHSEGCWQKHKRPCPSNKTLANEAPDEHWWSGWPGAYCMKCGDDDMNEACLAGCDCKCHEAFWKEYGEVKNNEQQ